MGGSMGPVGGSEETPWTQAAEKRIEAEMASEEALLAMKAVLEEIVGRKNSKGGKISTGQAYMKLMELSGDMTTVKGTQAGLQGATQSVGAAARDAVNKLTSDLTTVEDYFLNNKHPATYPNYPKNVADASADFSKTLKSLEGLVKSQSALPENSPKRWMDASTCKTMEAQIGDLKNAFDSDPGVNLNDPNGMARAVQGWVESAGTAGGHRSAVTTTIQQLTGNINAIGGGFGEITATQSALESSTLSQVTMMLNTMRGTITSITDARKTMVSGQRAAS